MTTTLSSKGQVVIPQQIRKRLGLPEGAVLACAVENGKIVLDPNPTAQHAHLEEKDGRPILITPPGAPEMSAKMVKDLLTT